jgi:iron complex transport system ATP-binding protein
MEMKNHDQILLSTSDLSIGYSKRSAEKTILRNLNLKINRGLIISLMGPNGSGKSTLISTLSGILPALFGSIVMEGKNILEISSYDRSELLGVVLTEPIYDKNLTVLDIVSLGCYHLSGWLGKPNDSGLQQIIKGLKSVGLSDKIHTRISELSDGEKQRVLIAKVLAQNVNLIILDEPTSHLDLPNRMELLLLLRNLAHSGGKGILFSTHELDLALQISDEIWLIDREGNLNCSLPEELILSGRLNETFGNEHISFLPDSASFELVPDSGRNIYVAGEGLLYTCVLHMIKRFGYAVLENKSNSGISVEVSQGTIRVIGNGKESIFHSLSSMQQFLILNSNETR